MAMARAQVMVMGTGASSGKTVLSVGLCRTLANQGYRVLPFKAISVAKSRDAAVNVPAMAAGIPHHVRAARVPFDVSMNPVLVVPETAPASDGSESDGEFYEQGELYVCGRSYGRVRYSNEDVLLLDELPASVRAVIREEVQRAYEDVKRRAEVIILEGAASPAELDDDDIANLQVARESGAPVVLVSQLSKGGAAGALIGTVACLPDDVRKQVIGFVLSDVRSGLLEAKASARVRAHTGLEQLGRVRHLRLWDGPPSTYPSDETAYEAWAAEVSAGFDVPALLAASKEMVVGGELGC